MGIVKPIRQRILDSRKQVRASGTRTNHISGDDLVVHILSVNNLNGRSRSSSVSSYFKKNEEMPLYEFKGRCDTLSESQKWYHKTIENNSNAYYTFFYISNKGIDYMPERSITSEVFFQVIVPSKKQICNYIDG